MNFADGLSISGRIMAVSGDSTNGFFSDDHGAFFDFAVEDEFIGAVDFEIREDAVVEDEPAWAPSTAVVDPLVKDAGDSVSDNAGHHGAAGMAFAVVDGGGGVAARGGCGDGTLNARKCRRERAATGGERTERRRRRRCGGGGGNSG